MVEFIESIGTFDIIMIIVMIVISIYFGLLVYRLGKIADLLKETPGFKKQNEELQIQSLYAQEMQEIQTQLQTLIKLTVNEIKELKKISAALNEDTEPYIIKKEDE